MRFVFMERLLPPGQASAFLISLGWTEHAQRVLAGEPAARPSWPAQPAPPKPRITSAPARRRFPYG